MPNATFPASSSAVAFPLRSVVIAVVALLAVECAYAQETTSSLPPPPKRVHELPIRQLVVRFRDEVAAGRPQRPSTGALAELETRDGARLIYRRPTGDLSHVMRLTTPLPRLAARELLDQLRTIPNVLSAEIDEYEFPLFDPNDPLYNDTRDSQWHLKAPSATRLGAANLPGAWDLSRGAGVVVAVIDTGVVAHSDLDANVIKGYDFIAADPDGRFLVANDGNGRDADPADPGDWIDDNDLKEPIFAPDESGDCPKADSSWHGTHVAGTLGALTNNSSGVAGIAHQGKVLVVRALGKCFGYGSDITDAIRWAAGASPINGTWGALGIPENTTPARVINLSLGSVRGSCPASRQAAIDAARALGAVVVAATGNESANSISQPANCAGVIAVTAHTNEGDKASYANVGPGTALSAPGGGSCTTTALNCLPAGFGGDGTLWRFITSTLNSGTTAPGSQRYDGFQGTSMSTPHVAGVAALLLSRSATLKPDSVRSLLVDSARAFPDGTWCAGRANSPCGAGMLDATRALQRLVDLSPTVTAQASSSVSGSTTTFTLTGRAVARAGGNTNFVYRWRQTSGTTVTLSSTDTLQTSFTTSGSGRLSFEFSAVDADGFSGAATLETRTNGVPTLTPVNAFTVNENGSVNFTVSASDPDGDPITLQASNLPAGATFNAGSGVFNWASATPVGTYSVSFTASDGALTSAPLVVTITVTRPSGGGSGSGGSSGGGGGGGATDPLLVMLALLWLADRWRRRRRATI